MESAQFFTHKNIIIVNILLPAFCLMIFCGFSFRAGNSECSEKYLINGIQTGIRIKI